LINISDKTFTSKLLPAAKASD